MATFTVEITDAAHLAGITSAREAYNASLPETVTDEEGNETANPDILATDEEYVQFVMSKAAESYANQYAA